MTVVVGAPGDFTLEAFRRVAVAGEGEGMALINGSPCATALAADVALHAGNRRPARCLR